MSENKYINKKTKRDEKSIEKDKNHLKNKKEKKEEIIKDNIIIGKIEVQKKSRRRIINNEKENEEEIRDCEIFINDKKK